MLTELRKKVLKANLDLVKFSLVFFTWGNASEIDRESGLVVIKPSGVAYEEMTCDDLVVVDLNGKVVEGDKNPSSDTLSHLEIYKAHAEVGGIVHTHSTYATAFAQSGRSIPVYGTTHADYFYGDIPIARGITKCEVEDYERNTGKIVCETFKGKDVLATPACLIKGHGAFAFGKTSQEAAFHAKVLEEVAKMAYLTENLGGNRLENFIVDKHYNRKHGASAYYGQKKS